MTLYFITGNKGKLKEAQAIIPNVESVEFDLPEIQSMDPKEVISEKLKEAIKEHEGEFFVEDTSLYIECLNGFPGPLIKWMLDRIDDTGIGELVSKYDNNKAIAKTVIGYIDGREIHFFSGEIKGSITPTPKGEFGFGWGKIFKPEGYEKTFGEMTPEEKNTLSMRKIALEKLQKFLQQRHG